MAEIVETTAGAKQGGAKGIKKVRGLLVSISDPQDSKFESDEESIKTYGKPKQQREFKLEQAAILEMFEGEEAYELKDGTFMYWEAYAPKGEKPSAAGTYVKCVLASAEEVLYAQYKSKGGQMKFEDWKVGKDSKGEAFNKGLKALVGQFVTVEKQPRLLFTPPKMGEDGKPLRDADGKTIKTEIFAMDKTGRANHFCFVLDEGINAADLPEYIRTKVVGASPKVALRNLMEDDRINQFPEFKLMLENDVDGFAEKVGVKIINGKFQEG